MTPRTALLLAIRALERRAEMNEHKARALGDAARIKNADRDREAVRELAKLVPTDTTHQGGG